MPSKVLYFSYVCSVVLGCLCFQLRLSCLLVKLLLNFLSVCVHCIMRGVSDVLDIKNCLPYHFSSSGTKSIPTKKTLVVQTIFGTMHGCVLKLSLVTLISKRFISADWSPERCHPKRLCEKFLT